MLGAVVLTPVLIGAVAPQLKDDLSIGSSALGLAVSCFWLTTGLSAGLGTSHINRRGWRFASSIALCVGVVAQVGLCFANSSLVSLMLWLALAGSAYGIVAPASNIVVTEGVPERLHGVAIAAKQAASPIAGVVAGLAVPLVALRFGWQWMFALAALCSILALCAIRLPSGTADDPEAYVVDGLAPPTTRASGALPIWLVTTSAALGTLPIGAVMTFSVVALTDAGISLGTAGLVIALSGAVSFTTRILAGWGVDRVGSDGVLPSAGLLLAGAGAMAALATGIPWLCVLGTVLGFCAGQGWPALMLVGVLTHHRDNRAFASGRFQMGTATGAALGPLLFGAVTDTVSMAMAFQLMALSGIASASLVVVARRRGLETGPESRPPARRRRS
jgi:MFS family permease